MGCAHHGGGSQGLEFQELLPVPGCFGKLTRLTLASEVALGWGQTLRALLSLRAVPSLACLPLPTALARPGSGQMAAGAASGCFGKAQRLGEGRGRAAERKVEFWSCGTG